MSEQDVLPGAVAGAYVERRGALAGLRNAESNLRELTLADALDPGKIGKASGDIDSLEKRVRALEADPALLQRLREEAEIEDKAMEGIIRQALNRLNTEGEAYLPERKWYVENLCRIFIQEVIEELGINQIVKVKEWKRRLEELAQGMSRGLRDILPKSLASHSLERDELRLVGFGLALANLIGVLGSEQSTAASLERTIGIPDRQHFDPKESLEREDIRLMAAFFSNLRQEVVNRHRGSIDFMRAMAAAFGPRDREEIMGLVSGINQAFSGFAESRGGREAFAEERAMAWPPLTPGKQVAADERFGIYFETAQGLYRSRKLRAAKEQLKEMQKRVLYSQKFEEWSNLRGVISEAESWLGNCRESLSRIPWYAFGRRGRIKREINRLKEEVQRDLSCLKKVEATLTSLELQTYPRGAPETVESSKILEAKMTELMLIIKAKENPLD